MSKNQNEEIYELQSLVKAQQEKIKELNEKLEAANEAIDSFLIYENKRPSFEFFNKRRLALDKYRVLLKKNNI